MLNEFKKFILQGNNVDLSAGVIIGAAFGAIPFAFTKINVEPLLGSLWRRTQPEVDHPDHEQGDGGGKDGCRW